ncbi:TPA: integrase [Pseudomonas aeruginosa]|uniref:gamma-mobile-trio integrase GmtZ n=1 Tax=Pseudomonas aeruginosa TaxID=287 RepID=UPI000FF65CB6|nr:VPA1269 family protein [Pseudomonas aeruginosa]RPS20896.1 integrase [Pseudomonas aeruginosa]HCR1519255.1 integrase [Pseudomonas aeruginosa]
MAEEKAMKVTTLAISSKVKGVKRSTDTSLAWVEREYPQLATWRALAVEWLKGEIRGLGDRLRALAVFFERYLIQQALPLNLTEFLARDTVLPEFYRTACPQAHEGVKYNNYIHSFLYFVLLREFSQADDNGQVIVSPAFHNPVPRVSKGGIPKRDESVYSPLPYGYIDELREMLAAGPNFQDWKWAQSGLDAGVNQRLQRVPDWFEVTEEQIDRSDPDCVWRERPLSKNGMRFEMWSPVRWVALLVKLILPLRTFQVRVLDSGEADTWRFAAGKWALNSSQLAQGSERDPLQQGIFRSSTLCVDGEASPAILYINTNKTADIAKSGPEKGYLLPWPAGGPIHQDVIYWLEKLRDWQERYNPIARRIDWGELDGRYIKAKSEVQLASYPETCFLFRMPEAGESERQFPLKEPTLFRAWFRLLEALEQRLAKRGETHRNGTPILFLPPKDEQNNGQTTLFPLHSLRVSLITALALEGQVPFPILQKLVGHSRLLMTLYYTKPGASHVREVILGAAERLDSNKEISIRNFLLDTEYDELLQKAICNSIPGLAAAIPQHRAARNPAGWMAMHHGLCLVGGNAGEADDNGAVGGCYNGGPNLGSTSSPKYGPVPGGSRNCVRCRWFMTEPHHLPALGMV